MWRLYVKTHSVHVHENTDIIGLYLRPQTVLCGVSHVPVHSEISGCSHDVRGGRQSNRRSGYHLQVEMEQRHVCVN